MNHIRIKKNNLFVENLSAVKLAKNGEVAAIVTNPINKDVIVRFLIPS